MASSSLPGNFIVSKGKGDLPMVTLRHPKYPKASCDVYVYGAHVARWTDREGNSNLYMSPIADYGNGKAMRGGVPVCWPQFAGNGPFQKHGFARNTEWELDSYSSEEDPSVQVTFKLVSNEFTKETMGCPFEFELRYTVTLGGDYLGMHMEVVNTGAEAMQFTTALHTYFSVGDIATTTVAGVGEHHYNDTAQGGKDCKKGNSYSYDGNSVVEFNEGIVDRVYKQAAGPAHILCDGSKILMVEKSPSFPDTVVWNIGSDSLGDMPAGDFKRSWRNDDTICVESAAAVEPVKVAPGDSW
ncbi:conserved hypothetical protein, partial [Perkinsus marinus ATCC 50983]